MVDGTNSSRELPRLLAWQCLSLLLTATGVTSQQLAQRGVDAPTAQSALVYALLAFHWVPLIRRPNHARCAPRLRWWQWVAIAAADVEANFLLVKAYQFTDLCSVTVLDAFTVPTVMVLSACVLTVRYSIRQCVAAAMCIGGIVTLFASDLLRSDQSFPRAWLGDILVLAGAALYGVSNVAQEHLVQHLLGDRVEYLAHLGAYGAVIALTQTVIFEREAVAAAWEHAGSSHSQLWQLVGLEAGFIAALLTFYIGVAALLEYGSTATTSALPRVLISAFWPFFAPDPQPSSPALYLD